MSDEETKKEPENIDKSLEAARDDSAESEVEEPFEASQAFGSEAQARRDDSVESFEFNEDGEEDLKKTLKKLRVDLKACQKEKEEYLLGWQKERADFANYKKGEDERRNNMKEMIREDILSRFLTVADSFNMAFTNREAWEKVDPNWRQGVEYIYGQMNSVFEEYGVKPIGVEGEAFNPNIHESIETVKTDKKELDHKVVFVIQKGYKLGERVLRPARVNVWEFKTSP